MSYEIQAIFYKLSSNGDGESTIQFKVPYKDLAKALAVSTLIKKVLILNILEQKDNNNVQEGSKRKSKRKA